MSIFEFNRNPSRRELFWFAGLLAPFGAVLGLVAVWQFAATWRTAGLFALAGAVLAAAMLALPPIRRPIYLVWMFAAAPIGWAVSRVAMAVVYYAVLTPIGLILRLTGRDAMGRRFDPAASSYWVKSRQDDSPAGYFRQF